MGKGGKSTSKRGLRKGQKKRLAEAKKNAKDGAVLRWRDGRPLLDKSRMRRKPQLEYIPIQPIPLVSLIDKQEEVEDEVLSTESSTEYEYD